MPRMTTRGPAALIGLVWGSVFLSRLLSAAEIAESLDAVKRVSQGGAGHAAAIPALKQLESAGATDLLPLLDAMNDANPLAMNWLRGAFEAASDRLLKAGQLPTEALEEFVEQRSHHPRVRRLAYEWLARADRGAVDRLIPRMLDDPSPEMRRDAVARVIAEAEAAEPSAAKALWKKALSGAVDEDQFDQIAAALDHLGEPVNRVTHFGLILDWKVIGPFDNREMKGFDVGYPPESEIDLTARYPGMLGEVGWQHIVSDDKEGKFDLAKLTAPHKGAIDYLFTTFSVPAAQEVEFRLATPNAWKMWLNGELLFAREEYHRGMRFDQYSVRGRLQPGENRILLKVCQNEQDQDWAQDWVVQFRICDLTGRALNPAAPKSAN